jgi:hypothetical protein
MAQVPLAEHDDMIKTFPSDRADQPFSMSILPWRSRRGRPVTNAHRAKTPGEYLAVDPVPIADDVSRCSLPAASFGELVGSASSEALDRKSSTTARQISLKISLIEQKHHPIRRYSPAKWSLR